jgi:hypothetical protein
MADELSERTHAELLALYTGTISDLSYFKTQQWTTTNYSFLLFASVVAIRQISGIQLVVIERTLLIGLVVFVAIAALVILQKLQDSIEVRQARLEYVRNQFGSVFNSAWSARTKGNEYVRSVWFLRLAVCSGTVIASWLMIKR